MEFNTKNIILFMTVLTTALSAGFFYAWIVSVIPGTKRVPDQAYLETMQSINKEILNLGFFAIFFGALIFLLCSSYLQYKFKVDASFYLIVAATLIYAVGTIGVTILGNVPLNYTLEALDLSTFVEQDYRLARSAFEDNWNRFNLVRSLAALTSFILVLLVLVKN